MKVNVTMKDIAERLDVSSVTVSKALNDKEGVSDELKEKIKTLADEMGYRYNAVAKSMKDGRSYNICVIIPERYTGMSQSFYLKVYQSIAQHLEEYGYYAIIHIMTDDDEDQLKLPRIYHEQRVDGFVLLGQPKTDYINHMKKLGMPLIFLDFYDENSNVDAVITDNFNGAYEITNYLIKQGHRDIAYVGNLFSTSSIQDRFLGYYKSLLEHKIQLNQDYVISDRNERGAFISFDLPEVMPTAFVCNCDQVAHLLMERLRHDGYKVPEDCSVVGFDNDIYATLTTPNLTTVEVDVEEMAKNAVKFICEKMEDPTNSFGRLAVKGKIIYRDSVNEKK
ncbi:substrate-binding domain-containing protein [Gracilibacillus caseinilyticus]|uniref:Substrate-binding domain-containing protein n=1 Tax=Gracilibacillus caseinilyticus TaxID=2932256 RepID=A0ABY4EWX7_9BACI|nr:substrate-binding domain-containing protein [Gracilibacillus caseinilyticus]UOQ48455.1 substrate-binding domain-containing protein [Gracilibacillus caseinilyticus]